MKGAQAITLPWPLALSCHIHHIVKYTHTTYSNASCPSGPVKVSIENLRYFFGGFIVGFPRCPNDAGESDELKTACNVENFLPLGSREEFSAVEQADR